VHDVTVYAGQAHRFDSAIAKGRKNVGIDLSGEDHFGHLERRIVGHPASINDRLLDAHHRRQVTELLAAAVHHTNSDSDLMQQGQLFGNRT
jgi:hypothetical protein